MTATSEVRVISKQLVSCSDPTKIAEAPKPWRLGPLDSLVAYQVPIAVVFVYEASESGGSARGISASRLQDAVGRLLNIYPHLTGRLSVDRNTGHRTIDRLDSGAEVYEAEVHQTLAAYRKGEAYSILDLPGGGNDLLAPFDPSFEGVRDGPILTLQYSHFACGAYSIGVRCSHVVTDGDGFFRMVGDLARICRTLGTDDQSGMQTPAIRSYLADYENHSDAIEIAQAKAYSPALFSVDTSSTPLIGSQSSETVSAAAPPVIGRELRFSTSHLARIRQAASDPNDPGSKCSTFIALSAFLYQTVHKARTVLEREDPARYGMVSSDFLSPLNLRSANRLPGLQDRYFPNALLTHYLTIPPDELASTPLHCVARRIYETLVTNAVTGLEAEQTCRWIAAQPNKNNILLGFRPGPGSFMISQWNRFDMYGHAAVQFMENQHPVLVAPPFTPISLVDGLGYVLPPHPNHGAAGDGLVVYLSLLKPVWDTLESEGFLQDGKILL